jgi:hypothetical protein
MLALKMCSLALEVPDPEETVTSHGTGIITSLASSSENGRPKMVFFGLLAILESKWDKSIMIFFLPWTGLQSYNRNSDYQKLILCQIRLDYIKIINQLAF